MKRSEIVDFIIQQQAHGKSEAEMRDKLRAAGWGEAEIVEAFVEAEDKREALQIRNLWKSTSVRPAKTKKNAKRVYYITGAALVLITVFLLVFRFVNLEKEYSEEDVGQEYFKKVGTLYVDLLTEEMTYGFSMLESTLDRWNEAVDFHQKRFTPANIKDESVKFEYFRGQIENVGNGGRFEYEWDLSKSAAEISYKIGGQTVWSRADICATNFKAPYSFSPDYLKFAANVPNSRGYCSGSHIIYDVGSNQIVFFETNEGYILAWADNENLIVANNESAVRDRYLYPWFWQFNLGVGQLLPITDTMVKAPFPDLQGLSRGDWSQLSFSPSGEWLAVFDRNFSLQKPDQGDRVWLVNLKKPLQVSVAGISCEESCSAVIWSGNEREILVRSTKTLSSPPRGSVGGATTGKVVKIILPETIEIPEAQTLPK